MKNKNKNGFVSMTLVYTFLIVFLFLMLAILNTYSEKNKFLEAIDEKINSDISSSKETKNTLLNKLLLDNSPVLDTDIKFHKISNLHVANGNGLFYTEDITKTDLNLDGMSGRMYYFRGEVENNYIVLGNSCFRIMRSNEDGSFRLRYGGKYTGGECPKTGVPVSIATSAYNTDDTNPESVGYMYGDLSLGVLTPRSNLKDILDNWYSENINGTEQSVYVVDTVFCNNRKIVEGENDIVYYNASRLVPTIIDPLVQNPYIDNLEIKDLTFKCDNKEDRFTLSTYSYGNDTTGNMLLNYPVGLVTIEDLIYAGGLYEEVNDRFYMNTGSSYWTMSPYGFDTYATNVYLKDDGTISHTRLSEVLDVVPVISINSNVIIKSGNGEYNKPYIIM